MHLSGRVFKLSQFSSKFLANVSGSLLSVDNGCSNINAGVTLTSTFSANERASMQNSQHDRVSGVALLAALQT